MSLTRVPVAADGMVTLKTWSFGIRLPGVGDKELVRVAKPKAVQGARDAIGDTNAEWPPND